MKNFSWAKIRSDQISTRNFKLGQIKLTPKNQVGPDQIYTKKSSQARSDLHKKNQVGPDQIYTQKNRVRPDQVSSKNQVRSAAKNQLRPVQVPAIKTQLPHKLNKCKNTQFCQVRASICRTHKSWSVAFSCGKQAWRAFITSYALEFQICFIATFIPLNGTIT